MLHINSFHSLRLLPSLPLALLLLGLARPDEHLRLPGRVTSKVGWLVGCFKCPI